MKATVYMRVAVDKYARTTSGKRPKFAAASRPTDEPLYNSNRAALPTVAFAIELELPDLLFDRARAVIAELMVPEEQARIAAKVTQ